ncbi:hypothetical protein [Methanolobus bombayensis]|uniref:hypothetical protein n=1 Tax=Methanolobus bombayensis TaxID=38023 RepID=UPI001AE80512|nr:hypothetical protein [Methanolobus bombayensis]MBP1909516.1 hypothetical protein [Methanolobus bombayensis]
MTSSDWSTDKGHFKLVKQMSVPIYTKKINVSIFKATPVFRPGKIMIFWHSVLAGFTVIAGRHSIVPEY